MFNAMYIKEPRQRFVFYMPLSEYEKLRAIANKESEGNLARLFRELGRKCISQHQVVKENNIWRCV